MAEARLAERRRRLPFRSVNRKGSASYDPGLQRHHLVPDQVRRARCFGGLLAELGHDRLDLDDFRRNGMLLPASEPAAVRTALPLHRGPHRGYNEMVAERFGQIEHRWSRARLVDRRDACLEALMRIGLLQRALRRRLLIPDGRRFVLNRRDPLGAGQDFALLDAMAETLWGATQPMNFASSSPFAA